ncbi:MAG: transposase [Candidatus Omnitrophica bacterium]|nr:transposase [Candidatus Omnitrophota bacterium]
MYLLKRQEEQKEVLRQRRFFHPEIKDRPQIVYLFGKSGRDWLYYLQISQPDGKLLKEQIEVLDNLNVRIKRIDYLVEILATQHPYVERLKTIPGIGKFLSVLVAYERDDIKRFPSEKKFARHIYVWDKINS